MKSDYTLSLRYDKKKDTGLRLEGTGTLVAGEAAAAAAAAAAC